MTDIKPSTFDALIAAYEQLAKNYSAPDSIFVSTEIKNEIGKDYILNARIYHHEYFNSDSFIMGSMSNLLKYFDKSVSENGKISELTAIQLKKHFGTI